MTQQTLQHSSVIAALDEQVGCYRRLAKLAQAQHLHVQQNHTEALLDVLKNRQAELLQIARLEQQLAPTKKGWPQFIGALPADRRAQAEGLMSETRQLLEQITAADKDDVLVLQQRKLNLGRQINQATAAKRVNRNYAAAAYGPRASTMDVQR